MANIDKIKSMARESGIKIKFICSKLGLSETYLSNVKNGKDRMTDERLSIIADILNTTPAYLRDETDDPSPINKKASSPSSDSENAKYKEIFSMIDSADEKTVARLTELLYLASLPDEEYDRVMAVLRIVAPAAQS